MFEISGFGVNMWKFLSLWICDCIDKWYFKWTQQNKLIFTILIGTELIDAFVLFLLLHPFQFYHFSPISYAVFHRSGEVGQSPAAVDLSRPQKSGIASETRRNICRIPFQLGSWIFQPAARRMIAPFGFGTLESRRKLEVGVQCHRHVY